MTDRAYVRLAVSASEFAEWPDLRLFTSFNEPKPTNWDILLEMLSIPTVLDLGAKLLFVFQCASYGSPLVAAFVEATNSFDLERLMVNFAGCACQRSAAGLLGQSGHQGLGRTGHRRRKTDDRSYGSREALRQLYRYRRYRWKFDRRGLPDPLVLAFYFTVHSDLIIQLIILRRRQRYLTTAELTSASPINKRPHSRACHD